MKKRNDYISELASQLPLERVRRARKEAEKEVFGIRLADLRARMGVRQQDIRSFRQSSVSKLEKRKDMKVSTLVEYLAGIGMGLEIRAYPKPAEKKAVGKVVLLKT